VDETGKPYNDQFALLRQIKTISKVELQEALTKPQKNQIPDTYVNLDDTLVNKVLDKCNVIRYLATKSKNNGELTHSERLVVLYTLGHLGDPGKQYIHSIIGNCSNYSRHITEKWIVRLKPFPMSCPKIREMLSDITPSVGCYCDFPKIKNSYPTPVLHADPEFVAKLKSQGSIPTPAATDKQRKPAEMSANAKTDDKVDKQTDVHNNVNSEQQIDNSSPIPSKEKVSKVSSDKIADTGTTSVDETLHEYLELKKSLQEINFKIEQTESKLRSLFDATGSERVKTRFGDLTRMEKDGKTVWLIEL